MHKLLTKSNKLECIYNKILHIRILFILENRFSMNRCFYCMNHDALRQSACRTRTANLVAETALWRCSYYKDGGEINR